MSAYNLINKFLNSFGYGIYKKDQIENDIRLAQLKDIHKGQRAFVIGSGGAGRAVIVGLSWVQNKINKIFINDISNEVMNSAKQHFSQFQHVMNRIEFISSERIPNVIKNCQLLVNATPVGMKEGDVSVIDRDLLHKDLYVYDVVYHRGGTQLIKDARLKGRPVQGGDGMLLYQGVEAFEKWTNRILSTKTLEVMRQALREELNKCQKQ